MTTPAHQIPLLRPRQARRVLLILTFTRWFPVGLVVGLFTLWQLERGLSVAQAVTASSITGLVVFLLELPTSGFADAFGRKPLLIASGVFNLLAAATYVLADSFWSFAVAAALMGIFRALDSGPLEAWFVDTVHETEPGADVDGALAAQGTLLGTAIAAGALVSGGLVWWHPLGGQSALLLPLLVSTALNLVHLVAMLVLIREGRRHGDGTALREAAASARAAPRVVRDGLRLLRDNPVLRGLVAVEVFWCMAMIVFETFQPIRLAELVGGEEAAGRLMGPVAAAGWGVFALGSGLSGRTSRRIGITLTAILARVLNGLGAVVMGLALGPVGLVAAYLVTYALHGAGGPMHAALLHREASSDNRATVLSINSMVAFGAFTVLAPLAGLLAQATSTQTAMVIAGAASVLGALSYLPSLRAERSRAHEQDERAEGAEDAEDAEEPAEAVRPSPA
jgi:predicted MFS family arabinose efflux permease